MALKAGETESEKQAALDLLAAAPPYLVVTDSNGGTVFNRQKFYEDMLKGSLPMLLLEFRHSLLANKGII